MSASSSHRLILASGSPRRRELMTEAGYDFEVVVPHTTAECGLCSSSGPAGMVAELAQRKAEDVAVRAVDAVLIACDTVAECGGLILGKPGDADEARQMLSSMSGRQHRVYSGICVWRRPQGEPIVRIAVTRLRMDELTEQQLDDYIASELWEGKAGAFGYQDRLGWVHIVEGSESNVVGLPMDELAEMLDEVGYQRP